MVLAFGAVSPVAAQTGSVYTFKQFGFEDRLMVGPFGSARVSFSLPPTWQLAEGTEILLRYTHSLGTKTVGGASSTANWVGGTMLIYYNDILIDTIFLTAQGEFTKSILIPAEALRSVVANEPQSVEVFFDASSMCNYPDVQSVVSIQSTSEMRFSYFMVPPPLELSKYPSPIYQESVFGPMGVTVVIPDSPSAAEIESALSVVASIGAMSGGELKLALSTLSDLSVEARTTQNLILVGGPSKFPILQDIAFPYSAAGGSFAVNGANADDGIIQLARSPWNDLSVILFVSGNSDSAVIKAGRAVATGRLVPSVRPDTSIVKDVNPVKESSEVREDRTFADLGFTNKTVYGLEELYVIIDFSATAEQALSTEAYVDLVTAHSDFLDFNASGMTLVLNDEVIGSIKYDKEMDEITTTRVKLLSSVLRRGRNQLTIISDLAALPDCSGKNLDKTWVTLIESSSSISPKQRRHLQLGKRRI